MMRETVQNLKEIVNCTEQEIYSMLGECNMDPNETVHRLLSQDTFHEVMSKHEKKKEVKASGESRSQRVSSSSGRGVRVGADHAGRSVPQINCNDSEVTRAKHVHARENGPRIGHTSSVLGYGGTANSSSAWSTSSSSYNGDVGNTIHFPGLIDSIALRSQSSSTLQHKWLGVPGQLSMADVVKMGRSQRKPSNRALVVTEVQNSVLHQSVVPNTLEGSASARCISTAAISSEANQETHSLEDNVFKGMKGNNEPTVVVGQHESLEEWTFVDHSTEHLTEENYHEPSSTSLHIDGIDSHLSPHVEGIQKLGHVSGKNLYAESTISDGQIKLDGSGGSSCSDDGSFTNISCDQQDEAEDVHEELLSATSNLHHLSLHKEEQEEAPAVIIPSHLQCTHLDCSHLRFGSFGSGASKSNLEVTSGTENAPPHDYSDTKNLACDNTERLRTTSDYCDLSITGTTCRNFDLVSTSQPELSRDYMSISERSLQINIPSASSLASSVTVQPSYVDYNHNHAQANLQVQDFAQLTNLPRLKSGLHSKFQSVPQATSSTTRVSNEPTLPSYNLPVPTYSQRIIPMGSPANMFTYPVLHQNIAYMQSPACLQSAGMKYTVPQYKSSMPLTGLPQSLLVGSGYGGYESSTNISGAFLQNPSYVASGMSVGYEEALRSQYKEGVPCQQSGNISTWLHGLGSQPQPAVPTSSFYGIQEQGHQGITILRQVQHPTQMGRTWYKKLYHSAAWWYIS